MTVKIKRIHSTKGPIRVVIYVRVSSRNQDIENSADSQIANCMAYIEKMGWVLVRIYRDEAKSGRDANRAQHNLMVHDGTKQDRDFDKVVMWKADRYARNENYATLTKAMLRKAGVEVIAIKDPQVDGPFGRLFETLLDLMAEIQSDGIAENVKRGTRHLARQGYYLGAGAPYGYRIKKVQVGDKEHQKLEIDPETSKVVKEAFDHCLAGKSLSYIIRDFYAKGIPSPNGLARWPGATISGMLHNPHYDGTIVWSTATDDDDGTVICPDSHPGIMTKEELKKVKHLLAAKYYKPKEEGQNNNPRELASSYMLSGIITCRVCGGKLQPKPAKSGKYAYYICRTKKTLSKNECDCPNRNSTTLEAIVMAKIREDILSDANINQLIDRVRADTARFSVDYAGRLLDLDNRLAQIKEREDRALQAFEMGYIPVEKYRERMDALKELRVRLEQEKAEAEAIMGDDQTILIDPKSVSDHATQLRAFLETLEPSEWKPIIRHFVRNVSVGYSEGVITYKIPLPDDDPFARRMTSPIDLSGKVLSSVKSAPGWEGPLFCPIYNLAERTVVLKYGEPMFTIDFTHTTEIGGAYKELKENPDYSRIWFIPRPETTLAEHDRHRLHSAPYEALRELRELRNFRNIGYAAITLVLLILTFMVAALAVVAVEPTVEPGGPFLSFWPMTALVGSAVSIVLSLGAIVFIGLNRRNR